MDNKAPTTESDAGRQIEPRRHDAGSGANETIDGLDANTEALRHAAEDTPSVAPPEDLEAVPVLVPQQRSRSPDMPAEAVMRPSPFHRNDLLIATVAGLLAWIITLAIRTAISG
jgi:hypothetical protein